MVTNMMKTIFLASPLMLLVVSGCTPMVDKNQPPPPVEPPSETVYVVPEPAPAPEPMMPEVIVLEGVNFDHDKATLKPEAVNILDHAVNVMQRNPDRRFSIDGHTDSNGTDQYNDKLSLRRANAVRDYLVQHGVDASRLDVSSHGERMPVADNSTKQGRAKNRRVEIAPQ